MSSKLQDSFFSKLKQILGENLQYKIDYRPKYLRNVNKTVPYEIDVFVHSLGIGFEVQGAQHFHRVAIFHNNPDDSRYNDEKKKELAKHRRIFIVEIFDSEVELDREALKNLIIKRAKLILPSKRFGKLLGVIIRQAKFRKRLKKRLPQEEYELEVENKIQQRMIESGFMPAY